MLQAKWFTFGVVIRPIPELAAYAKRRKKKQESWGTYVSLTVLFHKRTENQYGSREVGCIFKIFRLACAHILPHAFCFDWKIMFARYHPLLFLLVCYPGICLLSAGCWRPSVCRGSVDCLLTVCWPCWPSVDHVWNVDWVLTMCRLSVGHLAPVGCQLRLSPTCTSFVGTALISDFRLVICDKERWTRWFVETKNTIASIMGHNTQQKQTL